MLDEIEYIIDPVSEVQFKIMKFLGGSLKNTYEVDYKDNKPRCDCPAGIYRGYCKHKDWIHTLKTDGAGKLPAIVAIREQATPQEMKTLIGDIVKRDK